MQILIFHPCKHIPTDGSTSFSLEMLALQRMLSNRNIFSDIVSPTIEQLEAGEISEVWISVFDATSAKLDSKVRSIMQAINRYVPSINLIMNDPAFFADMQWWFRDSINAWFCGGTDDARALQSLSSIMLIPETWKIRWLPHWLELYKSCKAYLPEFDGIVYAGYQRSVYRTARLQKLLPASISHTVFCDVPGISKLADKLPPNEVPIGSATLLVGEPEYKALSPWPMRLLQAWSNNSLCFVDIDSGIALPQNLQAMYISSAKELEEKFSDEQFRDEHIMHQAHAHQLAMEALRNFYAQA